MTMAQRGPQPDLPVIATTSARWSTLVAQPLRAQRCTELAQVFRALGDPVRLRLLSLIASHPGGEACVCELVGAFDLTQPAISHHLKVLREVGLVTSERRGTWVYYSVQQAWIEALGAFLDHPATSS
jgi:ArsR family transcriptional regulator, arsenate/arsenite/antimonite-responsive transcriptional repressor